MLLSKKMYTALNDQIKMEFESAYMYLAMAACLADKALPGFAHWMREQAREETEHAMKIYEYIEYRGNRPVLLALSAPEKEYKDVTAIIKKSLEHEQSVTASINKLMDISIAEKDHATSSFLQWFVDEQVEEEAMFRDVLDKLAFIKPASSFLLSFDKQMGERKD